MFKTIPERVYEYGHKNGRLLSHFLIDVTASGRDELGHVLTIAFSRLYAGRHTVSHIADASGCLVLFDQAPEVRDLRERPWILQELPGPLDFGDTLEWVWSWLQKADLGSDEHDGFSVPGWHAFNGTFGIVDEVWSTFLAIKPSWIYSGK